jgi:hypothetical protein
MGVLLALMLLPASAVAVIQSPVVLDGPDNEVLELDGAAMARDGSGGVVYRKQVDGVAHVFAVPFDNGRWGGAVEVDGEDAYGASQPTIAAGEGGRLLVVWVQPRNVNTHGVALYELMSASLEPGAGSFGPALILDPNVGEPNTGETRGIEPSIAMAPSGQAYVVYRVVTNSCSSEDPPSSSCTFGSGRELVDVRVARFNFRTWSSLGTVNRARQIAMPDPTAANAPAIGIDLSGEGLVAWQEPDAGGVARIWARRLFGSVRGNVLEASPETLSGRQVSSDAEAPTVAMGPYGEARIAFLIRGAPGTAVPTTQLFLNSISSAVGLNASQLNGAVSVGNTASSEAGSPDLAIDPVGNFRLAWPLGASVDELSGSIDTTGNLIPIGSTVGRTSPTTINPAGGGTTAWLTSTAGIPAANVREDYAAGAFQLAQFGGSISGPVSQLSLGGSGQGDALIGWTVGGPGRSEVVGDFVQAPPAPFNLVLPFGWVRGSSLGLSWETSTDAVAGTTYTVYIDGKPRLGGIPGLSAQLSSGSVGDGVHRIQVLATDPSGQETMSDARPLKVDVNPPVVRLRLIDHGRGVNVRVTDSASGVQKAATTISFGDGSVSRHRASVEHIYRSGGRYFITAQVRDRVGNAATVHLRVRVQ